MVIERYGDNSFVRMQMFHPSRGWTIEVMAGAVVAIKESGAPINSQFLQINHSNLSHAIGDFPGGWKRIVQEAGYDPDEERKGYIGPQRLWGRSE